MLAYIYVEMHAHIHKAYNQKSRMFRRRGEGNAVGHVHAGIITGERYLTPKSQSIVIEDNQVTYTGCFLIKENCCKLITSS